MFTLISIASVKCQNFNGKITYNIEYSKMNLNGVTSSEFKVAMGSIEEFYIQSGNHKTKYNGLIMDWVIYKANEDKIYFKAKDEVDVFYKSSMVFDKTPSKIEFHDEVIEVLGYSCKKLTIHFDENSRITSYYSTDLPVDSELYKKGKYDGFYLLLSKTNAISLKTIYESPQHTKTITAINIKNYLVNGKEFDLPLGVKVVEAPW